MKKLKKIMTGYNILTNECTKKSKLFDYVNKQGVIQKNLKDMIVDFNIQFANVVFFSQ